MAKGNMLLGYSRGSVGDVVFTRSKGQQIARARNRNPKNPKTPAQMAQRVKFASVVEFFRRGNQNLFQFAFENKKIKQSDYNAFVSANADKGIYLTPEQLKNPNFAIVAPFIMTQGSLIRNYGSMVDDGIAMTIGTSEQNAPTTVAALSEILKAKGFEEGDIVTLVHVSGSAETPGTPYVGDDAAKPWAIGQFTINSSDTTLISATSVIVDLDTDEGILKLSARGASQTIGSCAIVSHVYADGLKVTSTTLELRTEVEPANAAALASAWVEECIDIWGASEEAILQGSLS